MAKIIVYTSDNCPYCLKAKRLLGDRGIAFTENKIGWDDDAQWDALYEKSKMKTVPQIFNGDALIGGYTELEALDKKDELASLKN
jgi:glutaredoxin 3